MNKLRSAVLDRVLRLGARQAGAPPKLIVGLGNPGEKYERTRHNVGFWCVERLARDHSIGLSQRRRKAVIGEGLIDGQNVVLAKPRTFVNRSGEAVGYLLARYRASPDDLLVITDDMDLPPGKIRLRPGGSAGGHKGIKSIVEAIGTQDFARVRVGIGRPTTGVGDIEHVLGTMSPEERDSVQKAVERAADATITVLTEGMTVAMNRFN